MITTIKVEVLISAPIEKIWKRWTGVEHIINWNFASDDWCAPAAKNDLCVGGKFSYRMEARDGSMGFDFEGTYTNVIENEKIEYQLSDGREVKVTFKKIGDKYSVIETIDAENINPVEIQKGGWQAILDNFKKYVEN